MYYLNVLLFFSFVQLGITSITYSIDLNDADARKASLETIVSSTTELGQEFTLEFENLVIESLSTDNQQLSKNFINEIGHHKIWVHNNSIGQLLEQNFYAYLLAYATVPVEIDEINNRWKTVLNSYLKIEDYYNRYQSLFDLYIEIVENYTKNNNSSEFDYLLLDAFFQVLSEQDTEFAFMFIQYLRNYDKIPTKNESFNLYLQNELEKAYTTIKKQYKDNIRKQRRKESLD